MTADGASQLLERPQPRAGSPIHPLEELPSGDVDLATVEDREQALLEQLAAVERLVDLLHLGDFRGLFPFAERAYVT